MKVSIIMGIYNGAATVERAINSCLTSFEHEIICVDDCSTDDTPIVLSRLAKENSNIKLLKNAQNKGLAYSLNVALSIASGEYICRMDADDISYKERIDTQITFLDQNPKYSYIGTACTLFDGNENIYGQRTFPHMPSMKDYAKGNPYLHPTLLIRREALTKIAGYNESKKCFRCEDYDLMFRLKGASLNGINLTTPLLSYYEDRTKFKHTCRSRLNEFHVKRIGFKKIRMPFRYKIYIFKPLLLLLLPKKLYLYLHNRKKK